MIETERAYLAGLFDGDGSVFMTKHFDKALGRENIVLSVGFSMQSRLTLEWIAQRFGGNVMEPHTNHRAFMYRASAKRALSIVEAVSPYVVTKKPQINFVLWVYPLVFKDARGGWGTHVNLGGTILELRNMCYEILHLINKRDSMGFHGKSGEFSERLTPLMVKMMDMLTLSQAAEGEGSAEGATTSQVSPNNNPDQERPTSVH